MAAKIHWNLGQKTDEELQQILGKKESNQSPGSNPDLGLLQRLESENCEFYLRRKNWHFFRNETRILKVKMTTDHPLWEVFTKLKKGDKCKISFLTK